MVALASVLQAALSGSFLRKLKDVAEQSSGSGEIETKAVPCFLTACAAAGGGASNEPYVWEGNRARFDLSIGAFQGL